MKRVLLSLLLTAAIAAMFILGGSLAHAQENVLAEPHIFALYGSANVISFDGTKELPSDFELGANARASLSPHLSLVGATYFGFNHDYLRGSLGVRVTATDATNPNFSVGFGIQRHFSSDHDIRPEEFAPDATIGWIPWSSAPKWVLVAQGQYGLDSNQAAILAGIRYRLIPSY